MDWIVERLLDPTPLTPEEIEEQVEESILLEPVTFINFHHPFYIGAYIHDLEDNPSIQSHFQEMLVRPKLRAKHEYIHAQGATLNRKLMMFERPYRPTVMEQLLIGEGVGNELTQGELREILASLWSDTEFPSQAARTWRTLYDEFKDALAPPFGDTDLLNEEQTRVYRGISVATLPDPAPNGLSWTTSQTTAEWFARRFLQEGQVPVLLAGTVLNSDVWFCTNDRSESEVVSDHVNIEQVVTLPTSHAQGGAYGPL